MTRGCDLLHFSNVKRNIRAQKNQLLQAFLLILFRDGAWKVCSLYPQHELRSLPLKGLKSMVWCEAVASEDLKRIFGNMEPFPKPSLWHKRFHKAMAPFYRELR
jgi:hypothetical protein